MADYLYHRDPDRLVFETAIVDRRPGAVRLEQSWLHPGGGGQVSDRGELAFAGGTVRLPQIVGLGNAMDLILTGRQIDADEALRMGLVSRVVSRGQALQAALDMAEVIASSPWEAVVSDRASVYAAFDLPTARALQFEAQRPRSVGRGAQEGASRFASGEGRHGAVSPPP